MQINYDITNERKMDLLCGAFEGGSNYWIDSIDVSDNPTDEEINRLKKMAKKAYPDFHWLQSLPIIGRPIEINITDEVNDKKKYTLGLSDIDNGFQVMATKYPKHFYDFISENDDATTCDVFLQCAIFGELVFG